MLFYSKVETVSFFGIMFYCATEKKNYFVGRQPGEMMETNFIRSLFHIQYILFPFRRCCFESRSTEDWNIVAGRMKFILLLSLSCEFGIHELVSEYIV